MAQCLVKNSEYRTKLAQSGIPEFQFYVHASLFVDKYGRFPNLDEIPGSNSSQHLKDTIHINNNNTAKVDDILGSTGANSVEEANIILNDQYSDLEIDILPLNKEAIIDIQQRPSEYKPRDIQDFEVDETPNSGVVFNQIFEKLHNLYGISIIPISNKELATKEWENIPDVKNVAAFVYQGNTYINTDLASLDAPIHEMTHILLGSIKFKHPDLYTDLISMADQFQSFTSIAMRYPNRTQQDIYEEVFVHEVAKYLAGMPSDLDALDDKIKYELHYNMKRLLDSTLMGSYSVKSLNGDKLYNMSLKQLARIMQSMLLNPVSMGSLDDASLHRMLANEKSDLMKNGDLREECL